MTNELAKKHSLISVFFRRIDVKDNILIHWDILPNGAPKIVKGVLLSDDVELDPSWTDERYSANRGMRLFSAVKEDMLKEYLPTKNVVKQGRQPHASQPVQAVEIAPEIKEKADELQAQMTETNIDNKDPFGSLTNAELMGILDIREVAYPPKAKKSILLALIHGDSTEVKPKASAAD